MPKNIPIDNSILINMGKALKHRGPDDKGTYTTLTNNGKYQIGLHHRRLSIIDIEGGAQPMFSPDRKTVLIFNGEIYNYKSLREDLTREGLNFTTSSDTEVLLNGYIAWGTDIIKKLMGQFVFTIWDGNNEKMIFGRDHYGLKPLFYSEVDNGLFYSSEIKGIISTRDDYTINDEVINEYLQYRYVPSPNTFYREIRKFPPGCFGIWTEEKGLEIKKFFQPYDKSRLIRKTNNKYIVRDFYELLQEAVKIRMNSDVPYGAFLSGGIDSSAIVALMANNSNQAINTFSIGFDELEYSEIKHSRKISKKFECNHTELIVESEKLIKYLPELVKFRDAPVSEPSDIPIYLLSREASKSVKMVLTGEGADEFMGGYEKYHLEKPGNIYRKLLPSFLHSKMIRPIIDSFPDSYWKWKLAIKNVGTKDKEERYKNWFGAMSSEEQKKICKSFSGNSLGSKIPFESENGNSLIRELLYFDQTSWLPDNLLERGDRMTMAASIEARMPFMDIRLTEFLSKITDKNRFGGFQGKKILRNSMRGLLPNEIIDRKKIGFKVPVKEWFKGDMNGWLHDLLCSDDSLTAKYYNPSEVKKIIDEHKEGKKNHEKVLWTMASLEVFMKECVA